MRIALDAHKLTKTDSGIGNYTLHLEKRLLEEGKARDYRTAMASLCTPPSTTKTEKE